MRLTSFVHIYVDIPDDEKVTLVIIDNENDDQGEPIDITSITAELITRSIESDLSPLKEGKDFGYVVIPDDMTVKMGHKELSTEEVLEHLSLAVVDMIIEAAKMILEESEDEVKN